MFYYESAVLLALHWPSLAGASKHMYRFDIFWYLCLGNNAETSAATEATRRQQQSDDTVGRERLPDVRRAEEIGFS